MKVKLKRILAASALLVFAMGTTVLGASATMDNDGYAYLNSDYCNGMRNVDAGTVRGDTTHKAYLSVLTTYYDGSEYEYRSSVSKQNQFYSANYEWSEDYNSWHKLFYYNGDCYDTKNLSAD